MKTLEIITLILMFIPFFGILMWGMAMICVPNICMNVNTIMSSIVRSIFKQSKIEDRNNIDHIKEDPYGEENWEIN